MTLERKPEREISDLIRREAWHEVRAALRSRHPADIADIIGNAPAQTHEKLFSLVETEEKPAVLSELASVGALDVLDPLSEAEVADIISQMAPDDAADVLGEMPKDRSSVILRKMPRDQSEEVRKLLRFEDDTAGGIMTPDVVAMREDETVEEALQAIAYVESHEPFYNANIVDRDGKLTGYVNIWELLRERNRQKKLGELVHHDVVAATVDMDQEEAVRLLAKYDLTAVPVVDRTGKLVGRVTADDAIDVMKEEASEDIFRLAGSDNVELEGGTVMKSCIARLPWLLITLGGGFITSLILRRFTISISNVWVLSIFVPGLLAMGGNTGVQSSTLVVRNIALGKLEGGNILKLLLKEVMVGIIMGLACSLLIILWANIVITPERTPTGLSANHLALVVGLALFSAMTFAAVFGALVPIILNKSGVDPAVASGPFITIANDISALLIYFGVTTLLVLNFM